MVQKKNYWSMSAGLKVVFVWCLGKGIRDGGPYCDFHNNAESHLQRLTPNCLLASVNQF